MTSLQATENGLSALMDTVFCWLHHEYVNRMHGLLASGYMQTKTGPVKCRMIHKIKNAEALPSCVNLVCES